MKKGFFITFTIAAAFSCTTWASQFRQITLSNEHWRIEVSPDTLEMTAQPAGKKLIQLSKGQAELGGSGNLTQTGNLSKWDLANGKITVAVKLREKQLNAKISSRQTGDGLSCRY